MMQDKAEEPLRASCAVVLLPLSCLSPTCSQRSPQFCWGLPHSMRGTLVPSLMASPPYQYCDTVLDRTALRVCFQLSLYHFSLERYLSLYKRGVKIPDTHLHLVTVTWFCKLGNACRHSSHADAYRMNETKVLLFCAKLRTFFDFYSLALLSLPNCLFFHLSPRYAHLDSEWSNTHRLSCVV